MIVGYHIIFGAYGFWLPNDPRGSWSDFVGSWNLFRYGPATSTDETRSVAGRQHDRTARLAAKRELKYLKEKNGRPPKCFARGQWVVFLDTEDVPRAVQYVEDNPAKEGKKRQRWSFVTPYPG